MSGESSDEDEDDEEEEDEDGGKAVEGDKEDCTLIPGEGEGDGPCRFGLLPSTRPQSLLPSLHCSFQGSWLHEFLWLHFSQENGLMSCTWCHSNEQARHDELTKGTRSYKRALLVRHGQTAEHRLNDPAIQESEKKKEVPETYSDYSIKPNENSYCYQLLQELNDQRKKSILCDVNIVVNGKVFSPQEYPGCRQRLF